MKYLNVFWALESPFAAEGLVVIQSDGQNDGATCGPM